MKPTTLLPFLTAALALPQDIFHLLDTQEGLVVENLPIDATSGIPIPPKFPYNALRPYKAKQISSIDELDALSLKYNSVVRLEEVPSPEGDASTLAVIVMAPSYDAFGGEQGIFMQHIGTIADEELKQKILASGKVDEAAGADAGSEGAGSEVMAGSTPGMSPVRDEAETFERRKCKKDKCVTVLNCEKGCHWCYAIHCH